MKETTEVFIFGSAIIFLLVIIVVSIFPIGKPATAEPEQNKGENEMLSGFEKLFSLINTSGGETFEQPISESISAKTESSIDVTHSHGNVTIKSWENDEVKLEGMKIVKAKDTETARMYAEMMKVEISSQDDRIIVKTIRPERDRDWQVNQITINYQLYIPKRMNVNLKNTHGNVFAGDFTGNLDVDCRHGDLQISQIGKDTVINHEHGNVEVSEIGGKVSINKAHGNVNIKSVNENLQLNHEHGNVILASIGKGATIKKKHGNLNSTDIQGNLKLENEHGDLYFANIQGDLEINKQHGKIQAETVKGSISIQSDHGDLRIMNVEGNVHLRGSHGNAHVENVSGSADIVRSHSKITLNNVANVVQH